MYRTKFEGCLKRVQKPSRYIGNEFNSIHKEWTDSMMSFAFCFPDVYEVGMSHLGMKILYHMLNEREDTVCERVFAPWFFKSISESFVISTVSRIYTAENHRLNLSVTGERFSSRI